MKNVRYKDHSKSKNHYQTFEENNMSFYKTPDLYLSAYLRSKGTILQNVTKENDKVIFIFQNKGNIKGLINGYFNDSSIGVLTYKAALRDLRSLIFNYQNLSRE